MRAHDGDITQIRVIQNDPVGRRGSRALRWTAFLALLALVLAVRVRGHGHHWSWPLFVWGVAVGLLAVPANMVVTRLALRALPLSEDTHASLITRVRARERSLYVPLVVLSVCFASYAALRDTAWPDIMETLAFAVAVGLPLWFLPKLRRRAERRIRGY
jgi:hypothetical protein